MCVKGITQASANIYSTILLKLIFRRASALDIPATRLAIR